MSIVYLKKHNDDVVSHCSCGDGRITYPPQMDCPWCGCGWLFCCINCRRAFTFAVGVELDCTWEEIATEDARRLFGDRLTEEAVQEWLDEMPYILADIKPGGVYVILDGRVLPATAESFAFDGW